MADDIIVLSYYDSLLRNSDMELLEKQKWLNDKLIGFAFEYFEKDQFATYVERVCFITPDVTQFIKMAQGDEVGIFVDPLRLACKEYVYLAVNDNTSVDSTGGSHWSLLMYSRRGHSSFSHFDSYGDMNDRAARIIARKIHPFLEGAAPFTFEAKKTPQQTNSCDCGVYVISCTEHLCKHTLQGDSTSLLDAVTPSSVSNKRTELKDLILRLSSKPS